MSAEKTTGIVLRVIEFSETSCIVTMMTRDFGKITLIAKGARRPKSPFEAALDVLAICRIVFLRKTSGAMSLLTEAKLERRFRSSATHLNRLYFGFYIVELLNTLTDEGDATPSLFDLALQTITTIDSPDFSDSELDTAILGFELNLLECLGQLPMLTKCVGCGKEKTTLTRVCFGLNSGGILCPNCQRTDSRVISVSPEGLELLLNLVGGQIGADELNSDNWRTTNRVRETHRELIPATAVKSTKIALAPSPNHPPSHNTTQHRKEIRRLVNQYITHLIGSPPKLHPFLKNL